MTEPIQIANGDLSFFVSLLGGLEVPFQDFGVVLLDAEAAVIERSDMVLSNIVTLLGRGEVPVHGCEVALRHAETLLVQQPKTVLRRGIVLCDSLEVLFDGLGIVPWNPPTAFVE